MNNMIQTFSDELIRFLILVKSIVLLFIIIVAIISMLIMIFNDWYTHKIETLVNHWEECVIYITDLHESKHLIKKLFVGIHRSCFNRFNQRPMYVYDASDTDGIITIFKTAQKMNKNVMIYIDTTCDSYVIALTLQNAIQDFQNANENKNKMYCCVVNNVNNVGAIIAMSTNEVYMDNYARINSISSKNCINLLKKSYQYKLTPVLKRLQLINLLSDTKNNISFVELKKNGVCVDRMMDYQCALFNILKELKCFYK